MQFVLPLDEDARSQRHATTLHVMLAFLLFGIGIAGIGLFFGFTVMSPHFVTNGIYNSFLLFGIASLLASVTLLVLSVFQKTWLRRKQNNLLFRIVELVLLAASSVLFFTNGWRLPAVLFALMSAVVIFAIFRERRGETAGTVLIEERGITVNSDARIRKLLWKEIDHLIFRFGILTIECTDNTLIQRNIAGTDVDPAQITLFARAQIEEAKAARPLNDW